MSSTPTAWKMDGLELSPQEKLNWLYAKCAELQEEIEQAGGSTVSVTAEYTQQTYNNKLATVTVDDVATDIYAPKVDVTTGIYSTGEDGTIARIKVGNTTKSINAPVNAYEIAKEYDETEQNYYLGYSGFDFDRGLSGGNILYYISSRTYDEDYDALTGYTYKMLTSYSLVITPGQEEWDDPVYTYTLVFEDETYRSSGDAGYLYLVTT